MTERASQAVIEKSIRECIENKLWGNLSALIEHTRPADIAVILEGLSSEERTEVIRRIGPELAARVIPELEEASEEEVLESLDPAYLADVLEEMKVDDAADSLQELSSRRQKDIIAHIEADDRREIEKVLKYDDESAGGVMTPEVITLREDMIVQEAVQALRKRHGDEPFHIYVVDAEDHLIGMVPLRRLILAEPDTPLGKIMMTNIITVSTDYDQEQAARIFKKYNLYTLPVVDNENRLVGRITIDDVVEIMEEEATEDILRLAGTGEEEFASKSIWKIVYLRSPWLFVCWLGELVSAGIIVHSEPVLKSVLELAAFLPIVVAMGGNVGSQASYTIVRGLALGRVDYSSLWKVLWKELRIGLLLGILFGSGLYFYALYFLGDGERFFQISYTLGISLLTTMLIASCLGSSIPLILDRMGIDPAIATGPFVTTGMDVIGIAAYFYIASILMM